MKISNFCLLQKGYISYSILCILAVFLSAAIFSSCAISKPNYIFKNITEDATIKRFVDPNMELKIQKKDLLSISISSLNSAEDVLFNAAMGSVSTASKENAIAGYLVNEEGNIYLHKLGAISVIGFTRKELKLILEKALLPFLKDPIVTVNYANHFITVMGEVGGSQMVNMPAENITLVDAIAQTGNTTSNANFKNLLIIRETASSKIFKQVNLQDESIFKSPWYYLQPKDILVIKPYTEKTNIEQKRIRNQQLFASFVTSVSITLIILDRIIRR